MSKKDTALLVVWSLCGLLVAYLQHIALVEYLYWRLWWFDIPMHLLGGLFIGLGFLYGYRRIVFPKYLLDTGRVIIYTLSVVFMVGLLWEVFELVTGMYDPFITSSNDFVKATLHDIFNSVGGGAIALLWYWYFVGFTQSVTVDTH